MIAQLPPHYSLRFALVGRADGVTSGMMACLLRNRYATNAQLLLYTTTTVSYKCCL